ncbi:hypothetical protein JHK85_055594 [Glycine max]|nr:hypothetical protein JHK85_055594 [Glycine max]
MFPQENHSNGYQHQQGYSHRERVRRGTCRSRASTSSHSHSVRVYDQPRPPCTDFDVAYFHSYAHLGIHQEMIKDRVRTDTYRDAIMQHQSFIAGKVYAIDASDIALQANEVVKANNLSDVVVVLHGRVEVDSFDQYMLFIFHRCYTLYHSYLDVEINEEVDVIISEWMGYMLLYESMLGSVINARDRWLKPGGLILPSSSTLYMAPVTHTDRYSDSVDFWRNVYGIDTPLHGFAFWFDVEFNGHAIPSTNYHSTTSFVDNHQMNGSQRKRRTNPNEALVLSTAPEDPPTHWQQTLIYFYDPIELEQDQLIEVLQALPELAVKGVEGGKGGRNKGGRLQGTSCPKSSVTTSVPRDPLTFHQKCYKPCLNSLLRE